MGSIFRGIRSDLESGLSGFIPESRAMSLHSGAYLFHANLMAIIVTVMLVYVTLNSVNMQSNFLLWLLCCIFLVASSIRLCARVCATCQLLQVLFRDHVEGTSDLIDHGETRLHTSLSVAFATGGLLQSLRRQLVHLDREFDNPDIDSLREFDSNNPQSVPPMSEEEINALPVHKYKVPAHHVPVFGSQSDGSSLEQAPASVAITERNPDGRMKAREDELTCTVCLELVNIGERIRSLRCLHQFHADCVDLWLRQHGACPLCKSRVVPERWEENGDCFEMV